MRPYDLALRYIGVKETPGLMDTPLIKTMLTLDASWPEHDEVPWCSAFVNFICWQLRLPRSKSLQARSWLEVGTPTPFHQAVPGNDVVILWRGNPNGQTGHVGFFAGMEGSSIHILGGNQGNKVGINPYPLERLIGVRRLA